jgi:hypothetical protein
MIKNKDDAKEKNRRDVEVTTNSFTQAVKNAGAGGVSMANPGTEGRASEEDKEIRLQAYDDLMRAKEAKNDTSVEGEKFRREE